MISKRIAALSALLVIVGSMNAMSEGIRNRFGRRTGQGKGWGSWEKKHNDNDCHENSPKDRPNKGKGRADGSGPHKDGTGPRCNKD